MVVAAPASSNGAPQPNPWEASPSKCVSTFKKVQKLINNKQPISENLNAKCLMRLNELSSYLNRLTEYSHNPLYAYVEVYNIGDRLKELYSVSFVPICNNPVYKGLCSIVDCTLEEGKSHPGIDAAREIFESLQEVADTEDPQQIDNWKDSAALKRIYAVLREQSYRLLSATEAPPIVVARIERCKSIFNQMLAHASPLSPMAQNVHFKDNAFFQMVWDIFFHFQKRLKDPDALESKIDQFNQFMNPVDRASRRGSASSSAVSSPNGSLDESSDGSPAARAPRTPIAKQGHPAILSELSERLSQMAVATASPPASAATPSKEGSDGAPATPSISPMANAVTPGASEAAAENDTPPTSTPQPAAVAAVHVSDADPGVPVRKNAKTDFNVSIYVNPAAAVIIAVALVTAVVFIGVRRRSN